MKSVKQIIREEIDNYRGNIKTPREVAEHIYNLLSPEQQEEPDAYRGVGLDEAIKSIDAGHLIYYSQNPMSRDWEVIEYSLGDQASDITDDEIDNYVNQLVPWENNVKGVNLTTDFDNAQGYSDIVLGVKLNGNYVKFSDVHIFAEKPEECEVIKIYYNDDEISKKNFLNKFNKNITEDDYRGEHTAPTREDSPMYDVTNAYGEDIYGSMEKAVRYFGAHRPYDMYSIGLIQRARNKPNMPVKIYRAVPAVLTNQEKINDYEKQKAYILKTGRLPQGVDNWKDKSEYYDYISNEIDKLKSLPAEQETKTKINSGDWVTINPAYAKEHGKSNLNNKYKVLTKTVSAKNLFTDGNDIHEWGYVE